LGLIAHRDLLPAFVAFDGFCTTSAVGLLKIGLNPIGFIDFRSDRDKSVRDGW